MQLSTLIAARPVLVIIILAAGLVLVPSLVIPWWVKTTKHMKNVVDVNASHFRSEMISRIENTSKFFDPISSSATSLARVMNSSISSSDLSPSYTESKVAPLLFQAFSVLPFMSQISYIGLEGNFLSYYNDGNSTLAMYSNYTDSSNSNTRNVTETFSWYKQPVDPDTGRFYGLAVKHRPLINATESRIQTAGNSTDVNGTLGKGWDRAQAPLFLVTIGIRGKGVIVLAYSVKALVSYLRSIELFGGCLYLATQKGEMLIEGFPNTQMVVTGDSVSLNLIDPSSQHTSHIGSVSCSPLDGSNKGLTLTIGTKKYEVNCAPIKIMQVKLVYALALPYDGIVSDIRKTSRISLLLLIVMMAIMVFSIFTFVALMVNVARREMQLCSALIKQMEATQQAERKSMNKSLAFARSSHDIRAALAGIDGLIELSYEEVVPGSDLETNLRQMDDCAKDLLGLLNSILDTSKMEAGKLQLEEEEFDVAHLLEDVVDLFHPVGMKKGIEVVLDYFDGSVLKFSQVKGDRGKLKQVLCNLLSNAVKFTSDGHVSVRAWAQNSSFEDKIIASSQSNLWKQFSCLIYNNREEYDDLETVNAAKKNPNSMEFVFEVDDTGEGIPREKQKSVFENFVQVKETALGHGGTGLGLGIVQSLVRLMGGEIRIVDKQNGEKGTCFRFSVLLTASVSPTNKTQPDIETCGYSLSDTTQQCLGMARRTPSTGLTSPQLSIRCSSPRTEGSHVVLLIQNEERRRTSQNFMEGLGIKVSAVKKWEYLHSTLVKINSRNNVSPHGSSGKSDLGSRSDNSSIRFKDVPLSSMDGITQIRYPRTSSICKNPPCFILLVIEACAGPVQELYKIVTEFKREVHGTCCKVVWLDKPISRCIQEARIDPSDEVILKPFHGSRLYQVIGLLPEFENILPQGASVRSKRGSTIHASDAARGFDSSFENQSHGRMKRKPPPSHGHSLHEMERQEETSSRNEKYRKGYSSGNQDKSPVLSSIPATSTEKLPNRLSETQEGSGNRNGDNPLTGMKILVAEDGPTARRLAMKYLEQLGATVELCENGLEALESVRKGLQDRRKYGSSVNLLPYDYILMDCEMPIMDGYEATREIRKEESSYGIHIPIIALTAHTSGEEADKRTEAGMDRHLVKPLRREQLLEAIKTFSELN